MKSLAIQKYCIAFTLLVVLLFSTVGVLFCSGALMDIGGGASMAQDCAGHSGHTGSFDMGVCDHVSAWHRLTQMVQSDAPAILLCLQVLLTVFLLSNKLAHFSIQETKTFLHTHERHRPFAYWTELFANGIVQPKIFA